MTITAAQALAYVEERHAELTYERDRLAARLAQVDAELLETADQARLLRKLTETE